MAVDNESGIKGYQYAIGTTPGGTDVVNWTTLMNVRGVTKTGLSLTTGQTYYFSVKAINGVGLTGPAANSNGQTVGTDTTPPSAPPAVRDGGPYNYAPDIDETNDPHDLYCNFDAATDNESGISYYQFAIGTTPGATDAVNWTKLPANARNGWATNRNFTPGQRYYASVRAVNNAGLTGPATTSDGQIVVLQSDTTPPSAPRPCATEREPILPPPRRLPSCRRTGTRPPIPKAASAATSTRSARRRAAPTSPTGPAFRMTAP